MPALQWAHRTPLAALTNRQPMASYDAETGTSGYQDRTPAGPLDPRAMTAPGSDGRWAPQPPPPDSKVSGMPGIGVVTPLPQTDGGQTGVGTEMPNQTLSYLAGGEPFTGLDLDVNKPAGDRVVSPHHPNSAGPGRRP